MIKKTLCFWSILIGAILFDSSDFKILPVILMVFGVAILLLAYLDGEFT
jgi:hypothetical protein